MSDSSFSENQKKQLRAHALALREQLAGDAGAAISKAICTHLTVWPLFQHASQVLFYYPHRQEIDLLPLRETHADKNFFLPCVLGNHELTFRQYEGTQSLSPGKFGIPEPSSSVPEWYGEPGSVILIPGLAFDNLGHRLGYGKGYYDRFLEKQAGKNHVFVGVTPKAAIFETLPRQDWDIPMHWLATENGMIQLDKLDA